MAETIKKFEDLFAWQEGHKLVLLVYKITKKFPKEETFCLASQMRRSAISITSNIAEGFSRKGPKEKIQFYYMAQGSITELRNQLIISKDVEYITQLTYNQIVDELLLTSRLLNGLIKKLI